MRGGGAEGRPGGCLREGPELAILLLLPAEGVRGGGGAEGRPGGGGRGGCGLRGGWGSERRLEAQSYYSFEFCQII